MIRRPIAAISGPALAGEGSGRLVQGKRAGVGVSKGTASVNYAEPGTHLVVTYAGQGRARAWRVTGDETAVATDEVGGSGQGELCAVAVPAD
jgi:hypothetical protein